VARLAASSEQVTRVCATADLPKLDRMTVQIGGDTPAGIE
jgi:hypothetical protein